MNAITGKFKAKGRTALLTALVSGLMLNACSQGPDETIQVNNLLAPVPADTPYLMASLSHLPEDAFQFQMQQFAPPVSALLKSFQSILSADLSEQPEEQKKAQAIINLAINYLDDPSQWEQFRYAAYGNGLFPVLRVELSEPKQTLSRLTQVHQELGTSPEQASGVSGDIFKVSLGHTQLDAYYGVDGNYFIATVLPQAQQGQLSQAIGQSLPAQAYPLASLEQMAQQYGYQKYNLGFADTLKIYDGLLAQEGSFAQWFKALDQDHDEVELDQFSPECRNEFRELVALAPYMNFGTERSDKSGIAVGSFTQLRPDLATAMQSITGDVPGIDQDLGGELSFSTSFRVGPLRDFVLQMARNVEAAPFQCEALLELNQSAEQILAQAGTPIPPFVGQLRGLKFRMDGLAQFAAAKSAGDIAMPKISGTVALFVDNAQLLMSMAQLFVPSLAELELATDGVPKRLNDVIPGGVPGTEGEDIYAALTDSAIGLTLGEGQAETLPVMMAEQGGNSGILAAYWFDYQTLAVLQEQAIEKRINNNDEDFELEMSSDDEELSAEEIAAKKEMLRRYSKQAQEFTKVLLNVYRIFGRSGVWVQPQADGLVSHQVINFKS